MGELPNATILSEEVMDSAPLSLWRKVAKDPEKRQEWLDLFESLDPDEWDEDTMRMFASFTKVGIEARLAADVPEDEAKNKEASQETKEAPPKPKPKAKAKGDGEKPKRTKADAFKAGDWVTATLDNGERITGNLEKIYSKEAHVKPPRAKRPKVVKLDTLTHAVTEKKRKKRLDEDEEEEKKFPRTGSTVIFEVPTAGKAKAQRIEGVVQNCRMGFLQVEVEGREDWPTVHQDHLISFTSPAGPSEAHSVTTEEDLFG